jgi:choline dehydrogenase-like flavoprotein
MIADFTSSTQITNFYDVVIVGGGVAGLILANTLAKTKAVLVLEAGDMEFSNRSQSFYAGDVLGDATVYLPLDGGRVRALGGTSNTWGADCVDLEAFDFEKRDYMPQSGWPIDAAALSKYHSDALAVLGVEGIPADTPIPGSKGNLVQFSKGVSKRRNVKDTFYNSMKTNQNLDLLLMPISFTLT